MLRSMSGVTVRRMVIAVGITIALLAITASAGAGPRPTAATAPKAVSGGTITLGLNSGWDTLDPAQASFTFARQIMQLIFDTLVRQDPKTGQFDPDLATSWAFSNNNTTLTMQIRKNVHFQDGTLLTAQAVVFSLDRIENPALKSPWAAQLEQTVKSISAKGSYTVVLQLKGAYYAILNTLSQVDYAPVSPSAAQKYGADFGAHPVGTGPFELVNESPNVSVTLQRYQNYKWAPAFYKRNGPAYLNRVVIEDIPEDATRLALERAGQMDVVYAPIISQLSSFAAPNYYVVKATRAGMPRSLVLNTTEFPFNILLVRQAVAYAINKQQIVDVAYGGIGAAANDVITPNLADYDAAVAKAWPRYNPAMAKTLLAKAGATPGPNGIMEIGGKPLQFNYESIPGTSGNIQDQIIQQDLAAIGMKMNIIGAEQATVLADLQACKNPLMNQLFAATDPDVMYQFLQSASIHKSYDSACYASRQMDSYLGHALTAVNPTTRANLYGKAQALALKDMPYVPFYDIENPYLVDSRVHSLAVDQQAFWDLYNTWVSS